MLLRVMGEMEKNAKDAGAITSEELLESLGTYHDRTGSMLMKKWNFPAAYQQVAEFHDCVEAVSAPGSELMVVSLGNVLVKDMGYGLPNPEGVMPSTHQAALALGIGPERIESVREQVKVRMEGLKAYLE
jgi:hypothetical protein